MDENFTLSSEYIQEKLEELQSEEDDTSMYSYIAFGLSIMLPVVYATYKGIKKSSCSSKCCGASFDIQLSRKASSPTLTGAKAEKIEVVEPDKENPMNKDGE